MGSSRCSPGWWGGGAVWISHLGHLIRHRDQVVFLADLPAPAPPGAADQAPWPSVAMIFAARDEALSVAAAVRSMLPAPAAGTEAKTDPTLRVIAVDDRSTDGTGAILDELAATRPELAVVHVTDLPAGWLGKTHALQVGSESPAGRDAHWLLFTDADVVFQPGAVRRAVAYAEANAVDMLIVAPEVDTRSVGERVFLTLFGLLFSLYGPIGRLKDRRSRVHIGVGAFNLVRAEVFRAVGGFRHLALSVDDDMRLGQTVKFAGYNLGLVLGRDQVSVRWQVGTWGMVRGVEKNFFAGLKFRLSRVVVVALGVITLGVGPFAGLVVGPTWTRVISSLGLGAVTLMLAATWRQSRIAWFYTWLLPAAAVLVLVALFRSVALTLIRGGVVWRSHLYPLATLKAHVRGRDAWLSEVWRSTR